MCNNNVLEQWIWKKNAAEKGHSNIYLLKHANMLNVW